ncbi:MAG TPA: hypothetical protein VHO03_12065 [Ignavibacteriales bacterium]|nr:hypothetical protein [Ignavibacteriales bacterium]
MRFLVFLLACIFLFHIKASAGPPFRTDDPIPVPFRHGEVYLFSTGLFDETGAAGVGPALEFNYGILPNTQFHLVLPMAFNSPKDGPSHAGYGDTEVGVKYRFVEQTDIMPDIGTFPIAELPTGNASKGLGNGKTQLYLPVWLQKDIGKWTFYGGGGYWINPGQGNKNWTFSGILVQYNFSDSFFLGTEFFHQTPSTTASPNNTGIHLGGGVSVVKNYQILFSTELGNGITSYKHYAYYLGLYHTF